MKAHLSIILLSFLLSIISSAIVGQNHYFGSAPETNISTSLKQNEISHYMKYWPLQSFSGNDKVDVLLQVVLYGQYQSNEKLSGIKVSITDKGNREECIAHGSKQFEAFFEKEEYAKIIVVIDQMLSEIKKLDEVQQYGAMNYISKGGIKIGFEKMESLDYSYIGIQYTKALIICRFSNSQKFLADLREALNKATKELYLPKNENKLKRVKKGNQEIQDIKVDDI